jgi:hypothetical protein
MIGNMEKWMCWPILAFAAGGAIPLFFVDFVEDSWPDRIWMGMSPVMALFTYSLFKRVGRSMPALNTWAQESHAGITVMVFAGTLITSGAAVLFAILPIPHWLHLIVGICLALLALPFLVDMK